MIKAARYLEIIKQTRANTALVPNHQACGVDSYSIQDALFESLDMEGFDPEETYKIWDEWDISDEDAREYYTFMEIARYLKREEEHGDGLEHMLEIYSFWRDDEKT